MASVAEIEGVGESHAAKLAEAGVRSTDALLSEGATAAGRAALAQRSGIGETLILKWVNHADLFRIKGVAGEYAELLEAAGVDTTPELAQRNAENLHSKMVETNAAKHLVRQVPAQSQVAGWIAEAKQLPRKVTY